MNAEPAWTQEHRKHAERLQIALRIVGDPVQAEEFAAHAAEREAAGRCPVPWPESGWRAWTATVIRNRWIDRRRRQRFEADEEVDREFPGPPEQDPHALAERSQDRARVQRAMHKLPAPDRAALLMRAHDFDYDEIAAELGCTPPAARKRVSRARKLLRRHLDREARRV